MQQIKCQDCGGSHISLHHFNHDVLDGEPTIEFDRPPDIKLSNAPKIVFAVPVGSKRLIDHFLCPKDQGGCGIEAQTIPSVLSPSMVPVLFMLSYHGLQLPLNVTTSFITVSGYLSSEGRQMLTKRALRMGAKYIIFWDDDVLPPADAVYRLYNFMEKNPKVGITAAVCTTRGPIVEPVVYKAHGDGCTWDFECGPDAKPEQIFAAGGGFTMVRASAIVDVIEKGKAENNGQEIPVWADEKILSDHEDPARGIHKRNIFWGHDVRLYRLLQEAGWYACIHGGVLCGHLDINTNTVYYMPEDAPGFQKVKDRLAKENAGKQEGSQGDEGVQPGDVALGVEARTSGH